MKKKGFTLIELLAVIVVLAIIALIATPIVMNVIKNAQMGAAERSADNYVKAIETLIATEKLDGNTVADGSYTIDTNGNLTFGEVEVSGTKPNGGTIKIEKGQVVKNESSIKVGEYTVTYEDEKATIKELAKLLDVCSLTNGEANTIGAKYTCNLGDKDRTFYVLEAGTSSKPATLLLGGNYDTKTQTWIDASTTKLDEIASVWEKLDRSQIGLPGAEQIVAAENQTFVNSADFTLSLTKSWLYEDPDNMDWGNVQPFAYYTSTPLEAGDTVENVWSVWGAILNYTLQSGTATDPNAMCVRPVIMLEV